MRRAPGLSFFAVAFAFVGAAAAADFVERPVSSQKVSNTVGLPSVAVLPLPVAPNPAPPGLAVTSEASVLAAPDPVVSPSAGAPAPTSVPTEKATLEHLVHFEAGTPAQAGAPVDGEQAAGQAEREFLRAAALGETAPVENAAPPPTFDPAAMRRAREERLLEEDRAHPYRAFLREVLPPPTEIARQTRLGLLFGAVSISGFMGSAQLAWASGWVYHGNYHQAPMQKEVGFGLLLLFLGCVQAPLAEEFIFRRIAFRWLRDRLARHMGIVKGVWIAGAVNVALFVSVHETKDPVAMAIRLPTAIALVAAYQKGGFIASVLAHALTNFVIFGPEFLTDACGVAPGTAFGVVLGIVAAALGASWLPRLRKIINK